MKISSMMYSLVGMLVGGLSSAHAAAPHTSSSAASLYESVKKSPVQLELFMQEFPKGADLHNHLSGAIYAESFLKWAAKDGLCVNVPDGRILPSRCGAPAEGMQGAASLSSDAPAWNAMVDALSMRDFVPTATDRSGHDHFFSTFERFVALEKDHQGDMLAEALEHAAHDHVQYLELQVSTASSAGLDAMMAAVKQQKLEQASDIPAVHQALQPVLPKMVEASRRGMDAMEKRAHEVLHCGTAQAAAGCGVQVHYLFETLRTLPPKATYPQLEVGYAVVKNDPRFVGVNIAAPEDDPTALHDYDLHMQMFHYLNSVYPGVKLSLHAGELTPSLVPIADLDHHIHGAIDVAGAQRIGHGIDVMWEHDPIALLNQMARQHIMVEVNLTSNDEILGIKGDQHPFSLYRKAGVPVALSTDDEGVSRGSLTKEYVRAAQTYHLSYADMVQLSRTGLEYSFVPGKSLWADHQIGQKVTACHTASVTSALPQSCQAFLQANPKARLQWQLETRFHEFERSVVKNPMLATPL